MTSSVFASVIEEELLSALKGEAVSRKPKKEDKKKAPEVAEFVKEAEPPPVVGSGRIRLSELLSIRGITVNIPPGSYDPWVREAFSVEDWPEEAQGDIPSINPHHIIDWPTLSVIAEAIDDDSKPILVGPPGTGKSTTMEWYAAVRNQPFMRFNMNGSIEPDALLGKIMVVGGETVWHDGDYARALKLGYMICEDEWTKAPDYVNMATQWLREKGGKLRLYDKPDNDNVITPHEHARMVYTDNTKGLGDNVDKYSASNLQDSSTLDRHGEVIEMDYLSAAHEVAMLNSWFPASTEKFNNNLVKFAALIRNGYKEGVLSLTFSPRTLNNVARLALRHSSPAVAIRRAFFSKLADDSERQAVVKAYEMVWGDKYGTLV